MMVCRPAERHPDRGGRPRLPRRARAGRSTGRAARSAGSRCRPACARATGCRSRSSRRRRRPSSASTTRTSTSTTMAAAGRRRRRPSGSRDASRSRSTGYAAARRPRRPGSSSPTRSSSSGIDPATGELILLIDEVLTPDSSRFWDAADLRARPAAGELRQAVRPRLARDPGRGTRRRPGRRCPTTSSRARGRATSRPTSGSPARASRAISRRTSSPHDELPVRRQRHARSPGILDPQGRAVEGSLGHLGIEGVHDVRSAGGSS